MAACDTHPESVRVDEAWERLLDLEHQVRELRQWLQAEQWPAAGPLADLELLRARGVVARHTPAALPAAALASTPEASPLAASHWQVVCLGSFQIRCAGREPPPCSSRRGWGILQYLLTRPGFAATRDALIEAFWPESEPSAGAHNLQMAVHALRRSLRGCGPEGSDEVVLFRDGQYALTPALTIDLDVHRFRAACDHGRQLAGAGQHEAARRAFEDALRLYGGPFLHDNGYDEWAEPHRAALQDLWLGVLGWLSSAYAAQKDWEQAATCSREILSADPYREDAVRQLLRCLAATGRLAEVERTFRACRERIRLDLQVEPAPETIQLYQQVMRASATRIGAETGTRRAARTGS
jgi:DNA-binding SARP family transcriptional activator